MKHTSEPRDEFEDELGDFGRRPSLSKRLLYFMLSLIVTTIPSILFIRVFVVDISKAQLTIASGILISSVILSISYHNLSFSQAARIRADSTPPTKGAFKGKKTPYQAALAKHERKISMASMCYSLAYNNLLFLLTVPFVGCYLFKDKVSGELNVLLSTASAAALALFNSHSALKAIGE